MNSFKDKIIDSSDKYVESDESNLSPNFETLLKDLDKKRIHFQKKNKGLLGRSFLRTWIGLVIIFMAIEFFGQPEFRNQAIIGSTIFSAVAAALFAGIYSVIKKITAKGKFIEELKMTIVPKVLSSVNPDLTYFNEGINVEDFIKSKLFVFDRHYFKSEDTIKGTINRKKVVISECNSYSMSAGNDSIKASTLTPFKGIFVELELENIGLSTPLKIIPSFAAAPILKKKSVLEEFGRGKKRAFRKCYVEKEDLIKLPILDNIINYKVFCEDNQVAESFLNPKTLKVVDYIFSKYENIGDSSFKGSALLKEVNYSTGIYISIVENKLYLALDWNGNLFEPSSLLKEGVEKSGLVKYIHRDLLIIDQIIKEVSLLDEANG